MEEILGPECSFENFQIADTLVKSDGYGFYVRGVARLAKGRIEEGIGDLEAAKEKSPAMGHAYWSLGNAYQRRGEIGRALQEYEKAAELFAGQGEETMAASAQRQVAKLRR